jgi:hypothetical protein
MCVCQWKNINNELLIVSFGQNINKILNITIGICATFTTKRGLNKMHPLCLHVKWGGLLVKDLISIFGVQGSNLTSWHDCGQQWYVDQIFLMLRLPRLRYLD